MLGYMGGDALKSPCFPSPMEQIIVCLDAPMIHDLMVFFSAQVVPLCNFPHGADGAISSVSNELELFTLRLRSSLFSIPQPHFRENDP